MKVRITTRAVYHKIAEVEVEIPDNIELNDVSEYLLENEQMYVDQLDGKLSGADWGFGLGMDRGDWTDTDQSSETRYDVALNNFGGHL